MELFKYHRIVCSLQFGSVHIYNLFDLTIFMEISSWIIVLLCIWMIRFFPVFKDQYSIYSLLENHHCFHIYWTDNSLMIFFLSTVFVVISLFSFISVFVLFHFFLSSLGYLITKLFGYS